MRGDHRQTSSGIRLQRHAPRLLNRTLLVVLPLHVVAFVLLYFGIVRIIRREVRSAYVELARTTLGEVIEDLHPAMESHDRDEVARQLRSFALTHQLHDLKLFLRDACPADSHGKPNPVARQFLATDANEDFRILELGRERVLEGKMAILAAGACASCHRSGERLGMAAIRIDLTASIDQVRHRVRHDLALLVGGWVVLVGLVNLLLLRLARGAVRSFAAPSDRRPETGDAVTATQPLLVDPVSLELYKSLHSVLQHQERQRSENADRMHRADQLASLGQLAAGLAHEIKNPLAGIQGAVELLRDGSGDEMARNVHAQIISELGRVNATIQTLLNFARPIQPRRVLTDVGALLGELALFLRPGLAGRAISLEVAVPPDLPKVSLDPAQFRQIVINLITNAADAIRSEGHITITAAPLPQAPGLILEVADDGPGIPADQLERVFEPFFTTKFSGTGLGLAVVRSLVAQHSGRIDVESSPGSGARFFVVIPSSTASTGGS